MSHHPDSAGTGIIDQLNQSVRRVMAAYEDAKARERADAQRIQDMISNYRREKAITVQQPEERLTLTQMQERGIITGHFVLEVADDFRSKGVSKITKRNQRKRHARRMERYDTWLTEIV